MSQTVGERLRKVRSERGLSLDQAAQTTRIRRNYLEALERGDREALPSAVQGRGFLRLYAGYLNLPAEELVAEWEGRPLPLPPAPPPEPVAPPRKKLILPEPPPPPVEEPEDLETVEEQLSRRPVAALGSSQSIFEEIGAALRRQREILGLSLGDVERHTRLRQHYLRAFETGRLDDLPSTVQSRGMLSNYAAFLNMDSETLMLRFAEGLQQRRLERLPAAPEPGMFTLRRGQPKGVQPVTQARKLITPDLLFIGGLLLVLFVFIVWTAARISSDRSRQVAATLPSVSDVLLYTTSPTAPLLSPGPSELAPTQATEEAATSETILQITPSPAEPSSNGTPEAPVLAGNQTATLGAINTDPVQVYIVARRRAFLRVTIDGQIKFNGRTVPGNAYPFSGQKTIEILTGDAAALQLFYNQKDLGSLGTSGQALDLSFTRQGVLTPTATITPTITATPLVSPTPTPGSSVSPTPSPTVTPLVP